MLLQQIVEKLDQELGRLHRLREIVAGLAQGPRLDLAVEEITEAPANEKAGQLERAVTREPKPRMRRGFGQRTRPVRQQVSAEKPQNALSSSIPTRPVVVSAAAVAKQIAAKEQVREVSKPVVEGTLGAMIRALGQQGAL